MKDWKTSVSGILAILTAIFNIFVNKTASMEDVTMIGVGTGLIFAKDSNATATPVEQ